ncbi:hypothetical protein Ait01nite_036930 [Actinoplanes italicus]|uniref:hypothetical protein n=1 Tax=Actinoplanes italicus TaxID=113567 RepID=UPI001A5798E9|nr:hypothetical protein [Actinoplanes italicus]GIE30648.1 hypothetical protein Ait01nite_036930 [Actinoplanes italicus]
MTGYSAHGDERIRAEWAAWQRSAPVEFPHVIVDGIGRAPRALHDVLTGRYLGAVLVSAH